MKKLLFLTSAVALLLTAKIFTSCMSKDTDEKGQQRVLELFTSKAAIVSMSPEAQKQAWIERMGMYLELDLSQPQIELIQKLIADLKKIEHGKFLLTEDIKQDAIALAKITPREDFVNLFCIEGISATLPTLVKTGAICVECINDLEPYVGQEIIGNDVIDFRADNCDCRWTCSQQAGNMLCDDGADAIVLPPCGGSSSKCCNPTGGCGLLGLQTCNGQAACP